MIEAADNRGFFTEWAANERSAQNYFAAMWLTALAISDGQSIKDVSNQDAKMAFSEFYISGTAIYRSFNRPEFLRLANSAVAYALTLPLSRDERETYTTFLGEMPSGEEGVVAIPDFVNLIATCADTARNACGDKFPFLPFAIKGLSFDSFQQLLYEAGKYRR
jgi:hypothetical protein